MVLLDGAHSRRGLRLLVQRTPLDHVARRADDPGPITSARDRPGRPLYLGFDEKRLRAALAQLATGLSALHDAQKIHRDIKPSNVLVNAKGRVVILDFGLIADVNQEREADATTDAELVGTPSYMAPEQAASKPMNAAADWYAVGVLLYEVLTGDVPFTGPPARGPPTQADRRAPATELSLARHPARPRQSLHAAPAVRPERAPHGPPGPAVSRRDAGARERRLAPGGISHPRVNLRRARSRAGAAQQGVRELAPRVDA